MVKLFAIRGREDDFVVVTFGLEGTDASVNGLTLHDHAGKAPERVVVDPAVFVSGVVAEVMDMNFHKSFLLGSGKDRGVDKAVKHFRQHRYNVYTHIGLNVYVDEVNLQLLSLAV